jgi:RNA polymerase sigma-70 factor, ECF subfamily
MQGEVPLELVSTEAKRRQEAREISDRELALRAREGDAIAFEALVVRKTPAVLGVARRILGDAEDARDVAQLVFVRVWEKLPRYDETFSFNTWLYRIATNLAIDFLRSARSRERAHGATLHLVRDHEAFEVTRDVEETELRRVFDHVSEALTEKQKAVFVLKELEGRDSREIAAVLKCNESTVRNHLFNARKILRRQIEKLYPEYLNRGGVR